MKPAGRMKFPTFGDRDRVGGNGETARNGLDTKRKIS